MFFLYFSKLIETVLFDDKNSVIHCDGRLEKTYPRYGTPQEIGESFLIALHCGMVIRREITLIFIRSCH